MFKALLAFAFAWSASSEIIEVTADGFVGDVPSAVKVNAKCVDQHKDCSFWAGIGECDKNPRYMLPNCPVSCDSCDYEGLGESIAKKAAANMAEDEAQDETGVECAEGDSFCKAAKIKARVPKGSNAQGAARKVDATKCEDRHTTCPRWKRSGECEINPGWMIVNCPQSCDACHLLNPKVRCDRAHLNISDTPAFAPGAMGEMFASIQERFGERYGVTVHSTDPWVVTFDNFVTHEEADALIAQQTKFERSTDSGKQNEFGETGRVLSQARTSSNSWCGRDCEKHPMVSSLLGRIEEVVGIQRTNYESFQVLRCKSCVFIIEFVYFCFCAYHAVIPV
jgi:prolyl 4-hydroxylase